MDFLGKKFSDFCYLKSEDEGDYNDVLAWLTRC